MSTKTVLLWAGLLLMAFGTVAGWFPLWKSAHLSPDSVQRRVYWTCAFSAATLFFISQLPDWKSALVIGIGSLVGLTAIALNWTGHIKIGGRKFAASPNNRRPDRPPALSKDG